jgi:hypothetical protein
MGLTVWKISFKKKKMDYLDLNAKIREGYKGTI